MRGPCHCRNLFCMIISRRTVFLWKTWIRMFPKIGVPQNGWFTIENPIKMDDLGIPLFLETPICFSSPTCFICFSSWSGDCRRRAKNKALFANALPVISKTVPWLFRGGEKVVTGCQLLNSGWITEKEKRRQQDFATTHWWQLHQHGFLCPLSRGI